jgi:hypothetical protein
VAMMWQDWQSYRTLISALPTSCLLLLKPTLFPVLNHPRTIRTTYHRSIIAPNHKLFKNRHSIIHVMSGQTLPRHWPELLSTARVFNHCANWMLLLAPENSWSKNTHLDHKQLWTKKIKSNWKKRPSKANRLVICQYFFRQFFGPTLKSSSNKAVFTYFLVSQKYEITK